MRHNPGNHSEWSSRHQMMGSQIYRQHITEMVSEQYNYSDLCRVLQQKILTMSNPFPAMSVSPCRGASRVEEGTEALGQLAHCCSLKLCRKGKHFTPVG